MQKRSKYQRPVFNGRFCLVWLQNVWNRRRAHCISICLLLFLCYLPVRTVLRTLGVGIVPKRLFQTLFRTDVPLPPVSYQVSVVVMNHNRPYLLKGTDLLPVLTNHPSVAHVLILHSNPETAFTNDALDSSLVNVRKLQHIDAVTLNADMGLAIRFHYCADAPTEWVLIVDDDMEVHPAAVSALIHAMIEDPRRIVGRYGRQYDIEAAPKRHGYDTRNIYGTVEVVLTKAMMLEKTVCQQFEKHMHIVDDLVPTSKPMWNGEDIFVNLVSNQYYNVVDGDFHNLAIEDLAVWDADTSSFPDEDSVSGNMDRNSVWNVGFGAWKEARAKANKHTFYRGLLWDTAKQRLSALDRDAFTR